MLAVAAALLLTAALGPLISGNVFILFLAAVVVGAWFGGLGAGLLATGLSVLAMTHFFITPGKWLALDTESILRLVVFLATALVVSLIEDERARLLAREQRARADAEASRERISELNSHLERRLTELQTLLDVVPVAISMAEDAQCKSVKINRLFAKLLGLAHADAWQTAQQAERPYRFLRDGKEIPEDELPLQQAAASAADVSDVELDVARQDGHTIHLFSYAAPLFDELGKVRGSVGAFLDITERKQTEARVEATLREKEVLLREIHHRVKNNLQIISSLLNLQAGFISDEQARKVYKESQDRVRSMALLHAILYQSRNLAAIDFAQYVRRLTLHLLHSYAAAARGIRVDIDVHPVQFGMETAIPCGLIINELVSNALQHAFPKDRGGEIRIELHPNPDSTYTLGVRDDGVGLPVSIDFRDPQSLGLQLVSTLSNQLEGQMEMRRSDGTAFQLTFSELKYTDRL